MVANFIPSPVGGKACRANAIAEHSDACLKPPTITYVILAGPGPHPGKEPNETPKAIRSFACAGREQKRVSLPLYWPSLSLCLLAVVYG